MSANSDLSAYGGDDGRGLCIADAFATFCKEKWQETPLKTRSRRLQSGDELNAGISVRLNGTIQGVWRLLCERQARGDIEATANVGSPDSPRVQLRASQLREVTNVCLLNSTVQFLDPDSNGTITAFDVRFANLRIVGKMTIKTYLEEHDRRKRSGDDIKNKTKEARALRAWGMVAHPDREPLAAETSIRQHLYD